MNTEADLIDAFLTHMRRFLALDGLYDIHLGIPGDVGRALDFNVQACDEFRNMATAAKALVGALAQHPAEAKQILLVVAYLEPSGGGTPKLKEAWPEIKASLQLLANRLRTPTETALPDLAAKHYRGLSIAPGGFTYCGEIVQPLNGQPLRILEALLASRYKSATVDELVQAMDLDASNTDDPSQRVKDTARDLRKALRSAIGECGDPLPSNGRGQDLTYRLELPN